jgi:hypothetical protein
MSGFDRLGELVSTGPALPRKKDVPRGTGSAPSRRCISSQQVDLTIESRSASSKALDTHENTILSVSTLVGF